ncbi:MAG: PEP-CTERM sorting domain-containing protein [Planctomycetota bacterium]
MAGSIITTLLLTLSTFGAPITYEGDLSGYGSGTGAVAGDSHPTPSLWSYWTYTGLAGDMLRVTVRRTDGALDPIFAIWFGEETDTDDFFDMFSDGVNATRIADADDELPPALPGPYGDPTHFFILPFDGTYTIAIGDHTADSTPTLPLLGYTITASVPEVNSMVLLSSGAGLFWLVRRRRAT